MKRKISFWSEANGAFVTAMEEGFRGNKLWLKRPAFMKRHKKYPAGK